jgi:hypothetical protein
VTDASEKWLARKCQARLPSFIGRWSNGAGQVDPRARVAARWAPLICRLEGGTVSAATEKAQVAKIEGGESLAGQEFQFTSTLCYEGLISGEERFSE